MEGKYSHLKGMVCFIVLKYSWLLHKFFVPHLSALFRGMSLFQNRNLSDIQFIYLLDPLDVQYPPHTESLNVLFLKISDFLDILVIIYLKCSLPAKVLQKSWFLKTSDPLDTLFLKTNFWKKPNFLFVVFFKKLIFCIAFFNFEFWSLLTESLWEFQCLFPFHIFRLLKSK